LENVLRSEHGKVIKYVGMLVKGDSIIVMWNRSSSVSIAITMQAEQLISSRGKKRALDSISAVFGPLCV
jgi:hypothetical protein